MKLSLKSIIAAAVLVMCHAAAFAEDYPALVNLTINRWDGVFAKGEKISVHADMAYDFKDGAAIILSVDGKEASRDTVFTKPGRQLIFEGSFDRSTSGMISVIPVGDSLRIAQIGFIVAPEGFEPGSERPKDLKRFWRKQIEEMRHVPMVIDLREKLLDGDDARDYVCYEFTITAADSIPCRGYMAMPRAAKPGSLPIYFFAHAAGVSKNHCRAKISHALEMAKTGSGCIGVDMNAHGLPDDMPVSYYEEQENGRLKDYSKRIITDHESYYFRSMFLRMERAMDYFCMLEQWDGKRILVQGESQGGAQAAAIAGIDRRIGAIVLQVPAMFDTEGELAGRASGWPKPLQTKGQLPQAKEIAAYYDDAQLLKGVKASIHAEAGLIDTTCPASGIYAGYNQAKGRKQIFCFPYRTHTRIDNLHRQEWTDKILAERIRFIENYLK